MATIRVLMRASAKWAITSTEIAEFSEGGTYDVREGIALSMFAAGLADPAEALDERGDSDPAPKPAPRARKKAS